MCKAKYEGGLCHVFENTLQLNGDLMEDSAVPSNLSVPKVPGPDWAATSAHSKKGPKPREHVHFFRMKRDCTRHCNKGFYSEKCQLEASIALCFERAGYLVCRDVVQRFTTLSVVCPTNTDVPTVFFFRTYLTPPM